MDLSKLVQNQLSDDALGKLSALLNTDSESTRKATSAAVPAVLAGLAGLAASEDGARKLAATLGTIDPAHAGNMAHALNGDTGPLLQQGSNTLSSLLGDGLIANIASAVGRYSHLDGAAVKKLLFAIGPTILGLLAGRWKSQGGSLSSLSGLLADEKQHLAKEVPQGFSLASIPGIPSGDAMLHVAGDALRTAGNATADVTRRAVGTAENTASSLLAWLLPIAALLLIGFGVWSFLRPSTPPVAANTPKNVPETRTVMKPELSVVPNVTAVSDELTDIFNSSRQALAGINNAASVESVLPKFTELSSKLDGIRNLFDKLPEAGRAAIGRQIVGKQLAGFQEQAAKALAIPGVGDQLKPVLDGISTKFAALNIAQVSQNASDALASLTKSLSSFTDVQAAEASAPELQKIAGKIDELKQIQRAMSPGGQSMIARLVTAAQGPLNELIAKVLGQLGPNASAVKPVLEEIAGNLKALSEPNSAT